MDLRTIVTELQFRGLDQRKVDSALRLMVHVYAVQGPVSSETGGVLVEDMVNTYHVDVVQVASQLFLDKSKVYGREVYRVRWGCEEAAKTLEEQLWEASSERWEDFVSQLDERYLGFFLPPKDERELVITNWKLAKDLKWFSVENASHGWNVLRIMDDIASVAWKLDLAFGFRPMGPDGASGPRALLHERALEALQKRKQEPPVELRKLIRLWRFFSEYDAQTTDFVSLMKECGLTLDDVIAQVDKFFAMDLTSRYREGQYPPYFVNEKKKKEFQAAVRDLLSPMDSWLSRRELAPAPRQALVAASSPETAKKETTATV